MSALKVLDTVALLADRPDLGLRRGQMGTIVEQLGADAWEVEFDDNQGRAYAFAALGSTELLALRTEPASA